MIDSRSNASGSTSRPKQRPQSAKFVRLDYSGRVVKKMETLEAARKPKAAASTFVKHVSLSGNKNSHILRQLSESVGKQDALPVSCSQKDLSAPSP